MQELSSPGLAAVSVVMDGQPLTIYPGVRAGEFWVAGVPGQEFMLRVTNLSGRRIEVLASVDGQDALKPQTADKYASAGLVIPAYDARGAKGGYDFQGFRLDDARIAAFKFGHAGTGRSIASKLTGSDANSGVLGFAIYSESAPSYQPSFKPSPSWPDPPVRYSNFGGAVTRGSSLGAPGGAAVAQAAAPSSLATEAGEVREDKVGRTHFTRGTSEPVVLVIRYDTEEVLRERGIIGPSLPDPFPGQGTGYEALISE